MYTNQQRKPKSQHGRKLFTPLLIGLIALSGCVKEDFSDCPEPGQGIVLRYRYDLNMDYADRFAEKVENLQAFIFGQNGILCDTLVPFVGAGTITSDWERSVDLSPGTYSIVTWAGTDPFYSHYYTTGANDEVNRPKITIGGTRLDEFRLFLNCLPIDNTDQVYPNVRNFEDLYHGLVQQVVVNPEGFTTITTSLVKDTKAIHVKITGLSNLDADVHPDDFELSIAGRNGHYRYDNLINEQASQIIYTPYQTRLGNDEWIADIKTMRLMKPETDPFANALMLLNIVYKPTNMVICHDVDLVDMILSGKIPARDSNGDYIKDDQGQQVYVSPTSEYLDRQDLFELTYEIEKSSDDNLIFTIYVNGWKITNIYPVP